MSTVSIIVLCDPSSSSDESLGRIFNALVLAADLKSQQKSFNIYFQGTGTRWISYLEDANHPAHGLYNLVKENIAGVSNACSIVFNAKADAEKFGIKLIEQFNIPGLGAATSIANLIQQGNTVLSF